mmetsp:Transcript_80990/g.135452  ORF Transcript_80990/g.135452 Transcript_80990/m.135452 type:complete len:265 (-) Transcript_80990:354-1148(-)
MSARRSSRSMGTTCASCSRQYTDASALPASSRAHRCVTSSSEAACFCSSKRHSTLSSSKGLLLAFSSSSTCTFASRWQQLVTFASCSLTRCASTPKHGRLYKCRSFSTTSKPPMASALSGAMSNRPYRASTSRRSPPPRSTESSSSVLTLLGRTSAGALRCLSRTLDCSRGSLSWVCTPSSTISNRSGSSSQSSSSFSSHSSCSSSSSSSLGDSGFPWDGSRCKPELCVWEEPQNSVLATKDESKPPYELSPSNGRIGDEPSFI